MKVKEQFQDDIIQFEVEGIWMIGNNCTGSLIDLSEDGKKMVEDIMEKGRRTVFQKRH